MKRRTFQLLALAAGALSVTTGFAKESKSAQDEVSFASPEEGIDHLVAALRASDLAAALKAFAIERGARDYSFVKMAERLQAISLITAAPPVKFEFYRDIAEVQLTAEAAAQIRNLTYSLLAPTGTALDRVVALGEGQDIGSYATDLEAALDPARLVNLKVMEIAVPAPEMANSEVHRRNILAQLGVTGGDDLQERMVLYEVDGRTYEAGFTFVRYGDRWNIRSMNATLAGTSVTGHATPVSEAEFAAKWQ